MAAQPGNGQMSNEQATRNGIQALESAFTGIQKSRQDVDTTATTLSVGFGGGDGSQFQQLLHQWDDYANVIQKNLEDMINQLNHTLQEHGKTQGSSNEAINQAYKQADSIFDQLTG
jgi:uncharacterized protein YukE